MKTMLINAPIITSKNQYLDYHNYFPPGLLYLATTLKKNNFDVKIWDANNFYENNLISFNEDIIQESLKKELYQNMENYKPDSIGIGCMFSGAFKGLKIIAKQIKEKSPDIPITTGGIHPSTFPKEILKKYNEVDYIILGEGEKNFLDLTRYLTEGKPLLNDIDGIAFRDKEEIKLNPKTKFIEDLDSLPFPDYSLLNIKDYKLDTSKWHAPKNIKIGQPFPISSSRGCPYSCNFCSVRLISGRKIRFRTPNNVLDQMESLYDNYDTRYFQFMDDSLTFDKRRIIEICDGITKRKMDIQFDTPNGVSINTLDKEIIDKMVDAGLVRISLSIESGSEYIRNKIIKKHLKTEKIYEVVEECAKHKKLFINSFFVVGLPQETHETLEETYQMIQKLPVNKFGIFFATPYPGTQLFNECIENKLIPHTLDDHVEVDNLINKADKPHFKPYALQLEDLIEFRIKCYEYQDRVLKIQNFPR